MCLSHQRRLFSRSSSHAMLLAKLSIYSNPQTKITTGRRTFILKLSANQPAVSIQNRRRGLSIVPWQRSTLGGYNEEDFKEGHWNFELRLPLTLQSSYSLSEKIDARSSPGKYNFVGTSLQIDIDTWGGLQCCQRLLALGFIGLQDWARFEDPTIL